MPESAAEALPLFPKERPSAETVKEWVEKAKPLLKPDETALIDGDEPRSLLVYTHSTLPPALVAENDPTGGGMTGIATIIFITLTMCVGAMILWTVVGARLNHLFTEGPAGKRIFQVCGLLLGLLWVAFLVQGPAAITS